MSVSFEMKLAVQWASRNLHRFDRRWKKCERERCEGVEGEMLKKQALTSAVHLKQLLSGVICVSHWHLLLTSHHVSAPLLFISFFLYTFCRLCIFFAFLLWLSHLPLSLLPSSPPSHQLLRHCVSLVLPLHWPGCITTPSPSNGFPMLRPSYLSCGHVSLLGSIAL